MIVARAPLRISFVGGGTDLPDFYRRRAGQVVSTTIDKFIYVVLNRTPMVPKVSAKYSMSETVAHPSELQHTRIRAALLDLGIERGIEIGSFGALPAKTGLGSSSSFSVALVKALSAYEGRGLTHAQAAESACRLEIELVGEPIGKQDQYAAAFGGFNVIQFHEDDSVNVSPVLLGYDKRLELEDHLFLVFTGLTRPAGQILREQRANIDQHFPTLCRMADAVPAFVDHLLAGRLRELGTLLHENWLLKKQLASTISNPVLDELYDAGMRHGAWGGKILGAGGGGCLLLLLAPDRRPAVRKAITGVAEKHDLTELVEIPVTFTQSGTDILFNGDHR
jgi:D-glycero-alpha-D-manno-heptose-7-phosphate kinase